MLYNDLKENLDAMTMEVEEYRYYELDENDPTIKDLIQKGKIKFAFREKIGYLANGWAVKL